MSGPHIGPSGATLDRLRDVQERAMQPGAYIVQPGTPSTSYGIRTEDNPEVRIATPYRLLPGIKDGSRAGMGREDVYADQLAGRTGWTVLVPYRMLGRVTRRCHMEVPGRERLEVIEVIGGQDNCTVVRVLCAETVLGKPQP